MSGSLLYGSQPIKCKTKANCDLLSRVLPLPHANYLYLIRVLISSAVLLFVSGQESDDFGFGLTALD